MSGFGAFVPPSAISIPSPRKWSPRLNRFIVACVRDPSYLIHVQLIRVHDDQVWVFFSDQFSPGTMELQDNPRILDPYKYGSIEEMIQALEKKYKPYFHMTLWIYYSFNLKTVLICIHALSALFLLLFWRLDPKEHKRRIWVYRRNIVLISVVGYGCLGHYIATHFWFSC